MTGVLPTGFRIDGDWLREQLLALLAIPSPTGFTEAVTRHVCGVLDELGVGYELTRRGAIRAELRGALPRPDRAIVAHLDTLGAIVRRCKPNGRLALAPIGHWSSRFAEGARCDLFTDDHRYRGTILPLLASGHSYGDAIDTQPVDWDQCELRIDEPVRDRRDLEELGIAAGDIVAIDPQPEVGRGGFIAARHLDDKAGVAAVLAAVKAIVEHRVPLPTDLHPLFTIAEEVGSGASAVLHQDVAEMVAIDNAPPSPEQESTEATVTIAFADSTGPFDRRLARRLHQLAVDHGVPVVRDVFRYYRCDVASALEAGNDIRTALICFGVDASHGYERTRLDALGELARLIAAYAASEPVVPRDRSGLGPLEGFPRPDLGRPAHEEA